MSRLLVIGALIAFVIAALSAFSDDVNVNEVGFISLGLAAYVGSQVVGMALPTMRGRGGRRLTRR